MKRFVSYILGVVALGLMAGGCSTTRVLADGEYRLAHNKIEVTNDKHFPDSQIEPYLKQKSKGWTPFMSVFNWQNGKDKGWDRFVRKLGDAPVVYDEALVGPSAENVKTHLEYLGYYDSEILTSVEQKSRKRVNVHYDITLGKRYPIKSLSLNVPEGEFEDVFLTDSANITVKPGDYLAQNDLEAESVRGSKFMRENGFYGFNKNYYVFEADTLSVPDSAILELRINRWTRNETEKEARDLVTYRIGDVRISYPATLKFRDKVLTGLNTITPGDLYDERQVNNTYQRLSSLRVFNSVNVEMNERGDSSRVVDCDIKLSQSKLQGFKINLEASTNSDWLFGVSPQLSYYHKNIFHGGEWFNIGFMGNFQFMFGRDVRSNEFGITTGLSFPKFLGLSYKHFKGTVPRTDINLSWNYQSRPEYTRNIISVSYGYNGSKGNFFYQAYPLKLNIVRLFNLDEKFYESLMGDPYMSNAYQNHFDLGMGGTFYYTTNTDLVPKTPFFYTRLQVDISGNLLSCFKGLMPKDSDGAGMLWSTPYAQYVRGELTLGKTWRFGRESKQALATRIVGGAGYAYGNSSALPFEKQFYAGGANSLRGWQARTIGPGLSKRDMSFVIPNQTGDIRLEANVEYRFPIVWKFDGALFVDAGNIWTIWESAAGLEGFAEEPVARLSKETFLPGIAADWGLGLRLDLNFIVVRVDAGFKMHDPQRDAGERWLTPGQWFRKDGCAIHFGVGYPF
ncbi:MAG: BamA/TamA family outer membrane protein [Bacteroidales bacterium]|nr:BamA/TamA family outer membrane protein [Bacteroidales bacterium]